MAAQPPHGTTTTSTAAATEASTPQNNPQPRGFAERIAAEIGAQPRFVAAAIALLDEGNTVPFIARYRKEHTGGLDDVQLRTLEERLSYLRELDARKHTILAAIEEQGKLTPELSAAITACDSKARLEDLYLPYKKRRTTKADAARQAGLAKLLEELISDAGATEPETLASGFVTEGYDTPAAALEGARAIFVDNCAMNADLVGTIRERVFAHGTLTSTVIQDADPAASGTYSMYFDFAEKLTTLPSHRILALFRGEKEGVLRLVIDPGAEEDYLDLIARHMDIPQRGWLATATRWAWRTKLLVSATVDARMRLKEHAEAGAVEIFAHNLRDVLLAAPAGHRSTLGLDPGYRNGVKVACVDTTGAVLDTTIVYPHKPQARWNDAAQTLAMLCATHSVELIAVGNGTASRETMALAKEVAQLITQAGGEAPTPVLVSEAGASVYSASALAAEEFPTMDVSLRGAVSIARRLQDPLAELVKIDPKSIGVGQYQHDVNQTALARTLDAVVEDAVNAVGVDVNTASAALLERVSGINATVAGNIVSYREEHGAYPSRTSLKKVPRLGPKAFEQAAGFLRIGGAANPLDNSAVHPEAYPLATSIAQQAGLGVPELIGNQRALSSLNPKDFVTSEFGLPTVTDVLAELAKPGRDPRPEFSTATFKEGVETISDLKEGMVLEGTVTNVAAFGAFVDIGVHQDGLVHISALADRYVEDPHQVVHSGQTVKVKVLELDQQRGRISLTIRLDDSPATGRARDAGKGTAAGDSRDHSGRGRGGRERGREKSRGARTQGRGAKNQRQHGGPSGAMADALRRAGLK